MIRPVYGIGAAPFLRGAEILIAGDDNTVTLGDERGGVVQVAIEVDYQAGVIRQYQRRSQQFRKPRGQRPAADVNGDMLPENVLLQAQALQGARHGVPGVIGDDQAP